MGVEPLWIPIEAGGVFSRLPADRRVASLIELIGSGASDCGSGRSVSIRSSRRRRRIQRSDAVGFDRARAVDLEIAGVRAGRSSSGRERWDGLDRVSACVESDRLRRRFSASVPFLVRAQLLGDHDVRRCRRSILGSGARWGFTCTHLRTVIDIKLPTAPERSPFSTDSAA